MILGLGIDLCQISRMEKSITFSGFIRRVFSPDEISYSENKKGKRSESYASAFAAREAFCKASGLPLDSVAFRGVSLLRDEKGRPSLKLTEKVSDELMKKFQVPVNVFVSISHEGDYAVAVVVIEA